MSYFFACWFRGTLTHDLREAAQPFTMHALQTVDANRNDSQTSGRWQVIAALFLALVAGYLVSGAATLHANYSYAATLDQAGDTPINRWGGYDMPKTIALDSAIRYIPPHVSQLKSRDSAMLVRGRDRYGNFDPDPAPKRDLDEAALAAHQAAVERSAKVLYDGAQSSFRA